MSALERRLAREPPPSFPTWRPRPLSFRALLELCGLAATELAEIERREHRCGLNDGQAAGQDQVVKQFLVAEQSSSPASVNRAALDGNREQNLFAVAVQRRHNLGDVHRFNRRGPRLHGAHASIKSTYARAPRAASQLLSTASSAYRWKDGETLQDMRTRSAHGLCGELGDDAAHANPLLRRNELGRGHCPSAGRASAPAGLGMTASRRLATQAQQLSWGSLGKVARISQV
jgi:hypothetical protein